jgi:F420-dependent oxidoreductase-like protein
VAGCQARAGQVDRRQKEQGGMKLGLGVGYSGASMKLPMETVLEAERLGYDSCWTAEAYGSDAIVPLTWIAARTERIRLGTGIMQIHARTPSMTAMTAMTLDVLSGGRFLLGLGPSGPQVIEGWHGVAYNPPITRMREYVAILREIFRREKPAEFSGKVYQLPYRGADATGLGRPLRSILHARPDLPIYTAAITPAGVSAAAEIADGFFPVWLDPERFDVFAADLARGFQRAGGGKSLERFDVAPFVSVVVGDDVARCRNAVKPMLALYIGGMGARSKNFYNDYAKKLGYEAEARVIQDLYLDGKRAEAIAAVPDALVDAVALCGPRERIADGIARFKSAPVGTLIAFPNGIEALRVLAELVL